MNQGVNQAVSQAATISAISTAGSLAITGASTLGAKGAIAVGSKAKSAYGVGYAALAQNQNLVNYAYNFAEDFIGIYNDAASRNFGPASKKTGIGFLAQVGKAVCDAIKQYSELPAYEPGPNTGNSTDYDLDAWSGWTEEESMLF